MLYDTTYNNDENVMKEHITTSEILKKLHLNRNTFQVWLDKGYISPTIQKSSKQGESNLFSLSDVCCIRLFLKLTNWGLSRIMAADLSHVSFESVGPGKSQNKFLVYNLQPIKGMENADWGAGGYTLFKSLSEVNNSRTEDDMVFIVINLLKIQQEITELFK